MNPWRLHVVPFPDVSAHAAAFDALLARTPEGGAVDYDQDQPKWWFLHHLVRQLHPCQRIDAGEAHLARAHIAVEVADTR